MLYTGFRLNQPEYTAYPEEDEFLLLDGTDAIVQSVEFNKNDNSIQQVDIKLKIINNKINSTN